jgi:hypothetical protein
MEVQIKLFGEDPIFLEIVFIRLRVLNYIVNAVPALQHLHRMTEIEVKQFSDREYRFLSIHHEVYLHLLKNKCKLQVIAEDEDGRTFYSNTIDF